LNLFARFLLAMALMSCSPPSEQTREGHPGGGTQSGKPTMADSLFRQDFRTGYASVLWTMMMLRSCNDRWNRPKETAELVSRLAAVDAEAIRRGLKPQMEQAARDNARRMATMRLDMMCNAGFERAQASAEGALIELERFMSRRAEETRGGGDGQVPSQNIRMAYLGADGMFFALQECREPGIVREVKAQRARFEDLEQEIAKKLGRAALTSFRDHARMELAVKMVQPCAGERGLQNLRQCLDRLAGLLS
jgi:hypothetical protein